MSYDEAHYDSEAEEAIDWYKHHKAIHIEHLILEYVSRSVNGTLSDPIEMAMEDRMEEAQEHLIGEEL